MTRQPKSKIVHNQVTRDDLNRIGRQMLDSKAAVAAIGSLKKMPSFSDIEIGLLDKEVILLTHGSLVKPSALQLFHLCHHLSS